MQEEKQMNIDQLIDEMEVYIDNCKTTGMLSGGSMIKVNREELLAMLDELRTQLPRELAESRQIIETRESIITDARAKAERIVQDAAREAGVMIDDNEIVALANMRAEELVNDAQAQADDIVGRARENSRTLQTGALQYTQNMLSGLEYMYSSIIDQEKQYFESVIAKLREEHRQIVEDKHEIDLQLGSGARSARSKEDFERKEEETQEN